MKYLPLLLLLVASQITFGQDKKIKKMTVMQILGDYKNDSIFPQDTISFNNYTIYDTLGRKTLSYRFKDYSIDTFDCTKYYYDHELLITSVYYSNESYSWKYYVYNDDQKLKKITSDRVNDKEASIKTFKYDRFGSLRESLEIYENGTKSKIRYLNEYDSNNNLLKSVTSSIGKSPNSNNVSLEHNQIVTKIYEKGILSYSKLEEIYRDRFSEYFYRKNGELIKESAGKKGGFYNYEYRYNLNIDLAIKMMRISPTFGRIWIYKYEYY